MKNLIHLFAVILLVLLTACNNSPKESDNKAGAPADSPTGATEVYIDVTDAPTEPETFADVTDASTSSNDASLETAPTGAPAAAELTDHQWNLSAVYRDGEQQNIGVLYGSVIRQTGAYITFDSDNTFNCVLGLVGCTGTYSTSDSGTTLHITTRYDGTSENGESCDENTAVTIDPETHVLSFTFNNAKHEFIPD